MALDIQSLVTWMQLHLARKWTVEEFLNSSSYILGHNSVLLPNKRSRFFSSQVCTTPLFVGSNNSYLISFNNWLAPVAKSVNSLWKRCWRASVDGWAASTFHSQCDGKGPTVTIIRVGRYIFGGYTSKSWRKCAMGSYLYLCSYLHGYIGLKVQLDSLVLSNVESVWPCMVKQ